MAFRLGVQLFLLGFTGHRQSQQVVASDIVGNGTKSLPVPCYNRDCGQSLSPPLPSDNTTTHQYTNKYSFTSPSPAMSRASWHVRQEALEFVSGLWSCSIYASKCVGCAEVYRPAFHCLPHLRQVSLIFPLPIEPPKSPMLPKANAPTSAFPPLNPRLLADKCWDPHFGQVTGASSIGRA